MNLTYGLHLRLNSYVCVYLRYSAVFNQTAVFTKRRDNLTARKRLIVRNQL